MCCAPSTSRLAISSSRIELFELVVSITVMPIWIFFLPTFKHFNHLFFAQCFRNSTAIEYYLYLFSFLLFLVGSFVFICYFFIAQTLSELSKGSLSPLRLPFLKYAYV